tara:strand:+ start:375 stop:626 length:252 start_codon:yes stop_codon:yes gene_type:complete
MAAKLTDVVGYLYHNVTPEQRADTGPTADVSLWLLTVQNGCHTDTIGVVYESATDEEFCGDMEDATKRYEEIRLEAARLMADD